MAIINNIDIVDLLNRIWLFREETIRSAQQGGTSVISPDMDRIREMLNQLDAQIAHIEKTGYETIDLPHVLDVEWPVQDFNPTLGSPVPENAAMAQMVRIWDIMGMELIKCGSRKNAGGLTPKDGGRLKALCEKQRDYLDNFIAKTHPIDMPQIESITDFQPGDS